MSPPFGYQTMRPLEFPPRGPSPRGSSPWKLLVWNLLLGVSSPLLSMCSFPTWRTTLFLRITRIYVPVVLWDAAWWGYLSDLKQGPSFLGSFLDIAGKAARRRRLLMVFAGLTGQANLHLQGQACKLAAAFWSMSLTCQWRAGCLSYQNQWLGMLIGF